MNLNRTTALALRIGIYVGMFMILIGLVMECLGMGEDVLYWGVLTLIASPFIGIVASLIALITEKDWPWVAVALVLIAITATGLLLSF